MKKGCFLFIVIASLLVNSCVFGDISKDISTIKPATKATSGSYRFIGTDRPDYMMDTVIDYVQTIGVYYKSDNSLKEVKSENTYYKELRFNNGYYTDPVEPYYEYGNQVSEDAFTYTMKWIKKYIYYTY